MGEAKKGWAEQNQKFLIIFFLVAGYLIGSSLVFSPLHELGHWHVAVKMEGGEARILDATTCWIKKMTPANLMAGYETETTTGMLVFLVLFLLTSRYSSGWRRWYMHLGLPLGYATYAWLTPLISNTVDFCELHPEWTQSMRTFFFFMPGIFVISGWFVLYWFRCRDLPSRSK